MENVQGVRTQWNDVGRRLRQSNYQALIENPLARYSDEELKGDAEDFVKNHAPFLESRMKEVVRAAHVARDVRIYDEVAMADDPERRKTIMAGLRVELTEGEIDALRGEKKSIFYHRGMRIVVATVSLAAFLQGFVQSSANGATLYKRYWGPVTKESAAEFEIGLVNAVPYLSAAILGCTLSDPTNKVVGRKWTIFLAAILIFLSSLLSALGSVVEFDGEGMGRSRGWITLCGIRIINGLGMGLKAVSTPILASETSVGYWRGSSILAWQLWVALGIMTSFAFNLLFWTAPSPVKSAQLILGSPLVPATFLALAIPFCPESPRYYLKKGQEDYAKAYESLLKVRNTELQALRDLYLVHKNLELEDYSIIKRNAKAPQEHNLEANAQGDAMAGPGNAYSPRGGWAFELVQYMKRWIEIFQHPRLLNAAISAGTVNLGQQLSGLNIFAFYSGDLFAHGAVLYDEPLEQHKAAWKESMLYSFAFGVVNFVFGLPAIRTIDSLGRRKWLLLTLPLMAIWLMAAALVFTRPKDDPAIIPLVVVFMLLHTACYSPGMGPIPFTLASEAFPLSHREIGTSFAIFINLFFAGLLAWGVQIIFKGAGHEGLLGIFAGFNVIAFMLVFFLVEETKRRSLEELDQIFAAPKKNFIKFQVEKNAPWLFNRWLLGRRNEEKPSFYNDTTKMGRAESVRQGVERGSGSFVKRDDGVPANDSMSPTAASPEIGQGIWEGDGEGREEYRQQGMTERARRESETRSIESRFA